MGFKRSARAESIRTDTHRKNKAMQQLLRASGFVYRGNMLCSAEPGTTRRAAVL
ncbi:MAG: hypothetical protein V8T41_04235 [Oscillospiraceae bacterium]